MSRDWHCFWGDIIKFAKRVQAYVAGMDLDAFLADQRTYDAVIRNLELIGEATKSLPREARDLAPNIDWRGIAGLRDILAHAYFSINDQLLWEIITVRVPELLATLESIELKTGEDSGATGDSGT